MDIIEFRGHTIKPASYENSDMPGHWFPFATVETPDGDTKRVALNPTRGIEQADANSAATHEAKRRIASNNL
jgi:hypothetical protein